MTLPQIVMLNHASSVNWKRSEAKRKKTSNKPAEEDKDPIVFNGKRVSELNTDEMLVYLSSDS